MIQFKIKPGMHRTVHDLHRAGHQSICHANGGGNPSVE